MGWMEDRAEVMLAAGRHAEIVAGLSDLTRDQRDRGRRKDDTRSKVYSGEGLTEGFPQGFGAQVDVSSTKRMSTL